MQQPSNTLILQDIIGRHYERFWTFKGRYVVVKGSRGSKKSTTAALWIIWHMLKYPLSNALVVRRYFKTLKESCYNELKRAIARLGLESEFEYRVSPLTITRPSTGQTIYFRGFDDAQKLTSIVVDKGFLNFVWIEEAFEIEDEEEFIRLDLSIRNNMPDGYFERFMLTFNPWSEHTFLKTRFFDKKDPKVLALTTTYLMNEWASPAFVSILERMKIDNPRRYKINGLGEWGVAEGLILTNTERKEFNLQDILSKPHAKAIWGLDFGFTDPTALIGAVLLPDERTIYIHKEWTAQAVTNHDIAEALKKLGIKKEQIICDSAEPKSIEELKRLGINAVASIKGADSVRFGIQLLQSYKIIVHPTCTETWNSMCNYAWKKDRNGKFTDEPDHEFSHVIDGLRYACSYYLRRRGLTFNPQNLSKV